jgi:nitrogen fixation-related uncharacterized protein
MSGMVLLGIVITLSCVVGIVIVGWMFWWAARADGRDQAERDARLRRR